MEESLGVLASRLRHSLEQFEAVVPFGKTAIEELGHPPVFGDSRLLMISYGNWTKGHFFEVDFSSAVVASGMPFSQRTHKLGRPSYINADKVNSGLSCRNTGQVIGKDAAGNWWLMFTIRAGAWAGVEEQPRRMSRPDINIFIMTKCGRSYCEEFCSHSLGHPSRFPGRIHLILPRPTRNEGKEARTGQIALLPYHIRAGRVLPR